MSVSLSSSTWIANQWKGERHSLLMLQSFGTWTLQCLAVVDNQKSNSLFFQEAAADLQFIGLSPAGGCYLPNMPYCKRGVWSFTSLICSPQIIPWGNSYWFPYSDTETKVIISGQINAFFFLKNGILLTGSKVIEDWIKLAKNGTEGRSCPFIGSSSDYSHILNV